MFVLTKFYIFVFVHTLILIVKSKDYCDPKFCGNKWHTLCKYKHEGPAPNCMNYERLITNNREKQDIVNKVNSRRNKVASGDIRSLPAASNMMKVEWNEELAVSAQRWADQCESDPDLKDSCRDLENAPVEQNIATIYGEATHLKPSTLVDLWYMELLNVNPAIISKYQPSSKTRSIHHDSFTQLVWSDTTNVGCGAAKFQERVPEDLYKNTSVYRLVCNFMPKGNIEGKHVYNEGPPCSYCGPNAKCDSTYASLCEITNHEELHEQNIEINNSNATFSYEQFDKLQNQTLIDTPLTETQGKDIDGDISLDFFSHLFNFDKNTTPVAEITRLCKDVFVDEFVDLLRKKLSTDTVLKEMLLSTKTSHDVHYSDAKVDAIVGKIYSQKTTPTTTISTDNESVNSTLLVDLVEAIIFRNRDKISTMDHISLTSEAILEARTVQMQAELGETRQNQEFTGHYFFPEEEEREEETTEKTESFYDSSVVPAVSDVVLEIEELKRNKGTNDFLDDILESDAYTESMTQNHDALVSHEEFGSSSTIEDEINLWKQSNDFDSGISNKTKRDVNLKVKNLNLKYHKKSLTKDNDMIISYNELLKILATDLKDLKLNEKFHCAHNIATALSSNILFNFL